MVQICVLMIRRPPESPRTDTLLPDPTLFRSRRSALTTRPRREPWRRRRGRCWPGAGSYDWFWWSFLPPWQAASRYLPALPWSRGMAPHHQSDALEIDDGAVNEAEYPAPVDHSDTICKRQDLLQLGGYKQNRKAPRDGCPEVYGLVTTRADGEDVRGVGGTRKPRRVG